MEPNSRLFSFVRVKDARNKIVGDVGHQSAGTKGNWVGKVNWIYGERFYLAFWIW